MTTYEAAAALPLYTLRNPPPLVQEAHRRYRDALGVLLAAEVPIYTGCLAWLDNGGGDTAALFADWTAAQTGVTRALEILQPGIDALERGF